MPAKILARTGSRLKKILTHHPYSVSIVALLIIFSGAWGLAVSAQNKYETLISDVVYDRDGTPLSIREDAKGHYVVETKALPPEFIELLLQKEDRFYYYHFGINPVSIVRAFYNYITTGKTGGSSTLTQQLAKNLLGTETARSFYNKLREAFYATAIEAFYTKEEILIMYANTVYLGHQVQGFETASYAYFDRPLAATTHNEQLSLLATLSYPSTRNPWETEENVKFSEALNSQISPAAIFLPPSVTNDYSFQKTSYFELWTAGVLCKKTCATTIDDAVTGTIRAILDRHITAGRARKIRNGAVVVIDAHNSELLTMVGSRDPEGVTAGAQINMALEPRPIGSTVKPFIYAAGFTAGLRPYTLVEDREYKYPIATGYSLYPKNYDGQYRGEITLHEALSNSLNVPSVKVLEFIGLENFYAFLTDKLKFRPIQDLDSYQYGIALGGLEMDLLTLTHYFTIFPQQGSLQPLKIMVDSSENFNLPPQSGITQKESVVDKQYIELVHAIISDRFTGVNQFGLESNLNLDTSDYGVKTGTSRDFHDSWVVGYTPDFVVGVWLGNSENEALDQVSGSSGAGAVWHDVMEYLLTTKYNRGSKFTPQYLERFAIGNGDEWGLWGDKVADHRNLLQQDNLILSVHEGDTFALNENTTIPLKARKEVTWSVDGVELATATNSTFSPHQIGTYEISASDRSSGKRETILVRVIIEE